MVKRKTADLNLTTVEKPVEQGYTEDTWSGLPHYSCKKCAFDTLDLEAMLTHLVDHSLLRGINQPAPGEDREADAPGSTGEVAQAIYEVSLEEVNNGTES